MTDRRHAALCVLLLCGAEITSDEHNDLYLHGLCHRTGGLTRTGFIAAYEQLAQLEDQGYRTNRRTIATAARAEAEAWRATKP